MKKVVKIGIIGAILGNLNSEDKNNNQMKGKNLEDFEILFVIKTTITMVNIAISSILIALYIKTYRKIKSHFTIGLIVVMISLLVYAITSNPLFHLGFGYRGYGMGPFTIIPDLFSSIALGVLLYLSLK